jgi:hypothetical protein
LRNFNAAAAAASVSLLIQVASTNFSLPFVCCCCATVERILATNNAHKKELSAKYEKRSKNWTEMDESV